MKPPKKPPPDTVGNVRGRIALLRDQAKRNASLEEGDPEKALARHLRAIEPELQKLRVRLAKVQKSATPAASVQEAPQPSRKPRMPSQARAASEEDEDILSVLDAL